ncbi:AT-hook motif nuclear-localized protein 7-like [Silene latifolia]|uniref:AT-hook motif nuclear-localized protein 7-like n=1 Tax=Silene latifolia TaxID=37657 RepID=UPI003D773974
MDGKEDISSGVSMRADGAPQGFYMAPRPENPVPGIHQQTGAPNMGAPNMGVIGVKKKMGRPRKYAPDGSPSTALSPMPISASIPLTGDLSGWKQPRARGFQALKKPPKVEFENLGDRLACLVGANFTPHVITVNTGEDVAMKILSFSQQESRAICVLSASGSISNVTLRQPNSSGGTLTYEGRFEILSLSGSFMPTDNGVVKSRSGGMSVSLAGPDGRVFGGGLAGLLVAATPIQVVLGSFLPGQNQDNKPKKPRIDSVTPVIPAVVNPVPGGGYGMQKVNSTSPPSFHAGNPPSMNSTLFHRDIEGDNNASSDGDSDNDDFDDGDDNSPLNLEISG